MTNALFDTAVVHSICIWVKTECDSPTWGTFLVICSINGGCFYTWILFFLIDAFIVFFFILFFLLYLMPLIYCSLWWFFLWAGLKLSMVSCYSGSQLICSTLTSSVHGRYCNTCAARSKSWLWYVDVCCNPCVCQACRHGHVQQLEHLLFYGADMSAQNASGNSALHICALYNQVSIVGTKLLQLWWM